MRIAFYFASYSVVISGTGFNAIYALFAAKVFDMHVIATEVCVEALECAQKVLALNSLQERVQLLLNGDGDRVFPDALFADYLPADAAFLCCVCNPPFYASAADREARTASKRTAARCRIVGRANEFFYGDEAAAANEDGGEMLFARRMLTESTQISNKLRWFTILLSVRAHVTQLIAEIAQTPRISGFCFREFAPAATKRCIVMWSFEETVDALQQQKQILTPHCTSLEKFGRLFAAVLLDADIAHSQRLLASESLLFAEVRLASDTWSRRAKRQKAAEVSTAKLQTESLLRVSLAAETTMDGCVLVTLLPREMPLNASAAALFNSFYQFLFRKLSHAQ